MRLLSLGFLAAGSISRPRASRRFDVYSPKLRRRLQCFGETIYHECLCLEADPTVLVYWPDMALAIMLFDQRKLRPAFRGCYELMDGSGNQLRVWKPVSLI